VEKKRSTDLETDSETTTMLVGRADLRDAVESKGEIMPLVKARLVGGEGIPSNQVNREEATTAFLEAGALEPPYDPEMLGMLFEHSNSLRQNIDAYATNIDAFGHVFIPVIDLEAEDAEERVKQSLASEMETEPTPEDVAARMKELPSLMAEEKSKLNLFFEFCTQDMSFVTLRRITREDREVTGNCYWEVLRDSAGEIAEFVYMPAYTVRLLPAQSTLRPVPSQIKVSDFEYQQVTRLKRCRLFVQIVETQLAFFKEYGDPYVYSSKTGRPYKDAEALKLAEPDVRPATEILHFKVHSSRSPYGVPRWIGNLLSVLGSRQAEEVNFLYFENKSVPPMAVLVSGGKMGADAVKRIEDYVANHIKGKRNFHKMLILEAEPAAGAQGDAAAKIRIQIVPLLGNQHNDALFKDYDAANADKVGQAFRLPRMLRGDIRDFNKSTAEAALTFAEMQIFQPEREEFDFLFNRRILPEMGIKYWRFRSLAPITRDPVAMSTMVKDLVNANVLTPAEGRLIAQDIFNRDFKKIDEEWTKQPMPMTLAGITAGEGTGTAEGFRAGGDTSGMPRDTEKPQEAAVRPMGGRQREPKAAALGLEMIRDVSKIAAYRKIFSYVQRKAAEQLRKDIEEEHIHLEEGELQKLIDQQPKE